MPVDDTIRFCLSICSMLAIGGLCLSHLDTRQRDRAATKNFTGLRSSPQQCIFMVIFSSYQYNTGLSSPDTLCLSSRLLLLHREILPREFRCILSFHRQRFLWGFEVVQRGSIRADKQYAPSHCSSRDLDAGTSCFKSCLSINRTVCVGLQKQDIIADRMSTLWGNASQSPCPDVFCFEPRWIVYLIKIWPLLRSSVGRASHKATFITMVVR